MASLPSTPGQTLARLRASAPLVHNITNFVAMDVTANALLAVGASPLMAHAPEELDAIVTISGAVAINIGTLSAPWVESMRLAIAAARAHGKPWVLDPVGAGATRYRTAVSGELASMHPAVIRGNASEILALAGEHSATKGVDSTHSSTEAREVARALARSLGCVVAVTGAIDYVTDGERVIAVANGHPMMTRVTALGCTATSLVAACLAVESDPTIAAAHALAIMGVCGELAARGAAGPGTFRVQFMDALYALDERELDGMARVS